MSVRTRRPGLIDDSKPKLKADPQGWLVLAITLVVLIAFFAWLYLSVSQDANTGEVIQTCKPGLCAFDIFSGVKKCPAPGQVDGIRISAGAEFCTSRDYCQQGPYTCAIQPDQSWRCDGVCGEGNPQCRCIRDPTSTTI